MAFYQKHPDYVNDDELHYAAWDLFYIVYREGTPEALVHINGGIRFLIGQIREDDVIFYRIPAMVYDTQMAFGTYPIRTIDDYLW